MKSVKIYAIILSKSIFEEVFMLFRKIEAYIEGYLKSDSNKILIIDGARQIGKSYIINEVGKRLFGNGFIRINLLEDTNIANSLKNVTSVDDFYFTISTVHGEKMGDKSNTLIFLDEIQICPNLITLLKFLNQDDKYRYIASGSLLGVTLSDANSLPIGSIEIKRMYQLDFEEFLIANGFSYDAINTLEQKFKNRETLDEALHARLMDHFRKYLIVGGLPDVVNEFLATHNVAKIRKIQADIVKLYGDDASKYDKERKLKIKRVYDMVPSTMQNTKKRVVVKDIENVKGKRYSNYADEFDYLISSGITHDFKAISNPVFPLIQSEDKNLLKLYMNDVGLLSGILYHNNVNPILEDVRSINLGALYETAVACQLKCLDHKLFYYDNKKNGEVDFLIDDFDNLAVLPLEVKSGRDYSIHSALDHFITNPSYPVQEGIVLSNEREIKTVNKVTYIPIYFTMFFKPTTGEDVII